LIQADGELFLAWASADGRREFVHVAEILDDLEETALPRR